MNVAYYPLDRHSCAITYDVMHHTSDTVQLRLMSDSNRMATQSEWMIEEIQTSNCSNVTSAVKMTVLVQRTPSFAVVALFILVICLSLVYIFTFLLPAESGQKVSVATALFVASFVCVVIMRNELPHNSDKLSYFILLLCSTLFIGTCVVLYSIVETRRHVARGKEKCILFKKRRYKKKRVGAEPVAENNRDVHLTRHDYPTITECQRKLDTALFVASFLFMALCFFIIYLNFRGIHRSLL